MYKHYTHDPTNSNRVTNTTTTDPYNPPNSTPRGGIDYYEDSNSEIYIDQTYPPQQYNHHGSLPRQQAPLPPPPPPRISRNVSTTPRPTTPTTHQQPHIYRPHTTTPSEYSSVSKGKSTNNRGVVIETMSAPNPCCPDSKGVCCILLLVNLGLLLVTLGFSVVLQLFEPAFVWWCGLLFLIVGFIALIVSLLFCMRICTFSRWSSRNSYDGNNGSLHGSHGGGGVGNHRDSELYWTHHWQKRINLPGGGGSSSRGNNNGDHNSDIVFHSSSARGE